MFFPRIHRPQGLLRLNPISLSNFSFSFLKLFFFKTFLNTRKRKEGNEKQHIWKSFFFQVSIPWEKVVGWSRVLTAFLWSLSHKRPGLTSHSTGPVRQCRTWRKTKEAVTWIFLISTEDATVGAGVHGENTSLLFTGSVALTAAEGDAHDAAGEGHV